MRTRGTGDILSKFFLNDLEHSWKDSISSSDMPQASIGIHEVIDTVCESQRSLFLSKSGKTNEYGFEISS